MAGVSARKVNKYVEDLFVKYHVDVHLTAHQHVYERTTPVYRYQAYGNGSDPFPAGNDGSKFVKPKYPINIVSRMPRLPKQPKHNNTTKQQNNNTRTRERTRTRIDSIARLMDVIRPTCALLCATPAPVLAFRTVARLGLTRLP